jgi:fructose-specific phosphotransferase system IIA component
MKICDVLTVDKIIPEIKGNNKIEVINEMIELFNGDDRIVDLENVKRTVLEREKIMSTGVGKGFAIPHGKTNKVTDIIAGFGKTTEPLDFESLDGQPVNLIFLLVGKENLVAQHIKLLSRISRMMNKDEFRKNLMHASTAEEIYAIFEEEEKAYN